MCMKTYIYHTIHPVNLIVMMSIVKKYRSPDQIVTLITAWLAGVGAVLLLAGSIQATQFTNISKREAEDENTAVSHSITFWNIKQADPRKEICLFSEKKLNNRLY